jgi:membrane associated rhomboid family serine protease
MGLEKGIFKRTELLLGDEVMDRIANVKVIIFGVGGVDLPVTVGASGAVFGILLAFGWLFPEARLMLIFFPVPIKARLFVLLYGVLELFLGVANFSGDNVAHFAHLGGMLFGAILIFFWKKRRI